MKRATNRIVLATEKVNRHGFRIMIDGVDISQYEKNPVMLWMHNRAFGRKEEAFLPLGNMIELKVEELPGIGKAITGQPVFDDTDPFAIQIFNKLENGTLRMASVGLIPIEWSEDPELLQPGQRCATLVKSMMEENSIVDIGSDPNALSIALYDDNHQRITLSLEGENACIPAIKNPLIETEMNKIELTAAKAAVLLGRKEVANVDEFETGVQEVVQLAARQKTQIETLTREKTELAEKLEKTEGAALKERSTVMLAAAKDARKIVEGEIPFYADQIKTEEDFERVKLHLDGKAGAPTIQQAITNGNDTNSELVKLCAKGYDELFESGELNTVKLNAPEDFKRIYKEKFKKDPQ